MLSSEDSCLRSQGCLTREAGYRRAEDALSELRTDTVGPQLLTTAGVDLRSQTSPAPPGSAAHPDVAERLHGSVELPRCRHKAAPSSLPCPPRAQAQGRGGLSSEQETGSSSSQHWDPFVSVCTYRTAAACY